MQKIPYTVTGISPNLVQVEIFDIDGFAADEKVQFGIGSYLKITDNTKLSVIAIVKSYRIKDPMPADGKDLSKRAFVVDAQPIGFIKDKVFKRGVKQIAIPPTGVEIATEDDLASIYSDHDKEHDFTIGKLVQNQKIHVPVDGNRFFSKHIAVVGSTGSGKSCTVAKILQEASKPNDAQKKSGILNNSHIVIFDIHGEYKPAFPSSQKIDVTNMVLPYWLMNGEELEEMFIESSEANSHNQISQFRNAVIKNKALHNPTITNLTYDTPVYFSLQEVYTYITNLSNEVVSKKAGETGRPKLSDGKLLEIEKKDEEYFRAVLDFAATSQAKDDKCSNGAFNGEFDRFIRRLETKMEDERLNFLLRPRKSDDTEFRTSDFEQILMGITGYDANNKTNILIVDLEGIPFEETSVVVALISRLLFDFAFYYKATKTAGPDEDDVPFLLVYEEAHKYVPNLQQAKYRSAKSVIEKIAKEGRKYGISLMIVSQRPSEISETIFSQCNNFVVMRLTNPNDQNYVSRLLPDTISNVIDNLPALESREAVLIGDAISIPSLILVDKIENRPRSEDIPVLTEWKKDWRDVAFKGLAQKAQRLPAADKKKKAVNS